MAIDRETHSDAREKDARGLLEAAARLVERALSKLDRTETPCPHCQARLFANREVARVAEQLEGYAEKLTNAADRLAKAETLPVAASPGYAAAVKRLATVQA